MKGVHDFWYQNSAPIVRNIFGSVASIAYQPVPKSISLATEKYGGNVMDMGSDGHRIIMEYDYSYPNGFRQNERDVLAATERLATGTREVIQKFIAQKKVPDIPVPLFMNDAYATQDMWGRFGKTDFMKKVKKQVDPEGVFGTRTYNWKM